QSRLDDALALLSDTPKSGGFHLSLAQRGRPDLLSVEFNTGGVSVLPIAAPSLHANHVIHDAMRAHPQLITSSSQYRQARGDPMAILSDQSNPVFPIYRCAPDDSDHENTMATADIRVSAEQADWQVYERPGQSARFSLVDARLG